jgi:hypothetical protein
MQTEQPVEQVVYEGSLAGLSRFANDMHRVVVFEML